MRAQVQIKAFGSTGQDGTKKITVEVINRRNEFSKQQSQRIEELCLEEELVRILEAGQSMDVNLIIALILSRQLGWPVDFMTQANAAIFVLVVPVQPFEGDENDAEGTKLKRPQHISIE